MVDIVAHVNIGSNIQLSKNERREISYVLHNACMINGVKVNVMSAIDMMVESLKRIILDNRDEKLILPTICKTPKISHKGWLYTNCPRGIYACSTK